MVKASERLKSLSKEITESVKPDSFDFLLKRIPEQIERRTRLGNGVQSNGSPNEKLKPLSKSYILARQGLEKGEARFLATVKLSSKSALALNKKIEKKGTSTKGVFSTFKGGFGKLKVISFKASGLPEVFQPFYPKKSYLTLTGKMLQSIIGIRSGFKFSFFFKDKESNQKAIWARESGRPFFYLSKSERNGVQRDVAAIIRESIRAIFK